MAQKQINVLTVVGTRPEIIKVGVLLKKLQLDQRIKSEVLHTGQHLDLAEDMLEFFGIETYMKLKAMDNAKGLNKLSVFLINEIGSLLEQNAPDIVLVHGDTITCFSAAVAAFNLGIPVGHVEAGLRTHNLKSPFPEEGYRQMVSAIAKLHFCPTEQSLGNIPKNSSVKKILTGNTVIDSLLFAASKTETRTASNFKQILVTGHRRENQDGGIEAVCLALKSLVLRYEDIKIKFSVHPSPKVKAVVEKILHGVERVQLCNPFSYLDFINEMKNSWLIVTDSGGIQEEAPSLKVPVLVTRDTTERPEAVECGAAMLIGSDSKELENSIIKLYEDNDFYNQMIVDKSPFGNGNAAGVIIESIINEFAQ